MLIKNINSFQSICILLFFWLCICNVYSQENEQTTFEKNIAYIKNNKSSKFEVIDSLFFSNRNDSLKMKYLNFVSKSIKYKEGECYSLIEIGNIYRNFSKYEESIKKLKEANKIAIELNNIELEIISLNMLGVVYRRLDLIRPALDYHKTALDKASLQKTLTPTLKHSISVSQNSLGNIYLTLQQYPLAINLFKKA